MDSIPLIAKDPAFPPIDRKKYPDLFSSYAHGPHLHEYLHEMNREVLSKYDIMTVGEGSAVTYKEVENLSGPSGRNWICYMDSALRKSGIIQRPIVPIQVSAIA